MSAARAEVALLLDTQLKNLSERLFEAGRKADQQITAWLTFTALTVLLCFGGADAVSLGGLELKATVAAAVTYGLACIFYYRAVLGMGALQVWRESIRERRRLRFATLLLVAKHQGPDAESDTNKDVSGFVSEYPGYVASSVLVKDEAMKKGGIRGRYIALVHRFLILVFAVSPYVLAASVLYKTWLSAWYVGVVLVGVMITLSANAVLHQDTDALPKGGHV